jgi:aryl-alcohol dehydrogenase-like predicted oxidoreductase
MKVPAYGKLFQNGILDGMHQAMGYTLSLPGVHCCVIAADNVKQLEENWKVALAFKQLNPTEMAAIEKRTAVAWQENTFFRQWT